jgi:hypothetical protein
LHVPDAAVLENTTPAAAAEPNGDGSPSELMANVALGPAAAPAMVETPPAAATVAAYPVDLEQRVRRLEEALAQLHQERREPPVAVAVPAPVEHVRDSQPSQVGFLFEAGRRLLGSDNAVPAVVVPYRGETRRPFLFELWAEARAIVRMFLDPRYRLSWSGRLGMAGLLFLIATSHLWFPLSWLALVGTYLDKTVDVALAFVLFKVVSNEARKYRQTSPDLPPSLRL